MVEEAPGRGQLIGAMPTPFDERGRLDLPALEQLFGYFAQRKLSGLALLTEVAESEFLDLEEQHIIVKQAQRCLSEQLPFWVQLNQFSTRAAVEFAGSVEASGAHGLLVSLARLPGLGYPELYRHIDRIAKATTLPLLLTVRPGNLAWCLTPEEQSTLAKHPRLSGAWIAEGGVQGVKAWSRRFSGEASTLILNANTFELAEAWSAGASGALCALALLAPDPARAVIDALGRGDLAWTRKLRKRLRPALDRLGPPRPSEESTKMERFAERIARRPIDGARLRPIAPPAGIKVGLELQGHRMRAFVRPPQRQIEGPEREDIRTALRASGMLG